MKKKRKTLMYELRLGRLENLEHPSPIIRRLETRYRHTYILGPTGTGKSTLMVRMALNDVKHGLACIFVDPKGQEDSPARQLYSLIPDKSRVIYFSYDNPPFVINPLRKRGYQLHDLIDEFVEILDILIKQTSPTNPPATENMKEVLEEAISNLQEEDRNLDLLYDFLRYETTRNEYFAKVGRQKPKYWKDFDEKDKTGKPKFREPVETARRIATRLNRFIKDERFRRIVTGENELDIADLARQGKVVIVDTSQMSLAKRVYITALFSFAVKSYCEFQKQDTYYPLLFYLDECYMGMNDSFQTLLPFTRSFKVGFTLAHQAASQFDSYKTLKMITGNCNTKIGFMPAGADEVKVLSEIYALPRDDFLSLEKYKAWIRILNRNSLVTTYPLPHVDDMAVPPAVSPGKQTSPEADQPTYDFLRDRWFPS